MDAKEQAELTAPSQREDALRDWYGDGKLVDNQGAPLVLYRGVAGSRELDPGALNAEPRDGYAVFASPSPYVASSYANPDFASDPNALGSLLPIYVKAERLIEFPVRARRYGGNDFDKFAFDRAARQLQPGEVLVARKVVDYGPRATEEIDPARLYSYSNDVYAFGRGTQVKSAVGNNTFDPNSRDIRFSRAAERELAPEPTEDARERAFVAGLSEDGLGARHSAFWHWFRGSKVINEDSSPKVVFHGTDADIEWFDGRESVGWFSESPQFASEYADLRRSGEEEYGDSAPNVLPVYLAIQRPLQLSFDMNDAATVVSKVMQDLGIAPEEFTWAESAWQIVNDSSFMTAVEAAGYDGISVKERGEPTWAILSPSQAKSAIGNSGNYSLHASDIRFSRSSAAPVQSVGGRRVVSTSVPKAVFEQLKEIDWRDAIALVAGKTEKPGGVDPVRQFGTEPEQNGRLVLFGQVPLSAFVANDEGDLYDGTVNRERAESYARRVPDDVPPVIAVLGRLSGKLNILDGGHRLTAARMRGDATIPVILKLRRDTELVFAEQPTTDPYDERFPSTSEATSAFLAWFGESKIVRRDGAPQLVYHAGHPGEGGAIEEGKTLSPFKFFADDRDRVSGQPLVPAYLRIQRPLDLSTPDGLALAHQLYGIFDAHDDVKALKEKVWQAQESLEYEQSRTACARLQYVRVGADGNVIAVHATPLPGYAAQRVTLLEASAERQDLIEAAQDALAAAELALDRAVRSKALPPDLRKHFQGEDAGERLRSAGFDGVIFQDAGSTLIAALDPGQIALAHDFGPTDGLVMHGGVQTSFGLTVGQVKAALAQDRYAHDVDIYADFEALPPDVKDQARRESNRGVEGFWDTRRNKVALVAEFIGSAERARQVARHELVGHYGLENMLGPREMQRVVSQVIEAEQRGNTTIKRFAARVDAVQPGLPPDGRAMEVIAMLAEHDAHNGIARRLADGVRVFLRGIGFLKSDTTDAQVCGLLRDAERYLAQKVATAPGRRTRARVFARGGRLLADCAATPWHRSLEDGAVYRVLDAKLGPRLIAVQNAEPRAKFAYFGAGGVKEDWQVIDALGDAQRASLTKIGGAREIMVAGPNVWRRRSLLDNIRDTAFLKLVARRRREGRRWRSAVRASMGEGPAGRAAVARIRDRDFEALRRPVYYGTIKAQQTDRDLLRSFGAELGAYDQALGVFHARVGRDAYQSLQAFSNDFEIRLTAVDEAGHADKAIRTGDRSALQQQLARLVWKLNARELAGDVRRGILAEVATVEQELQLVAPLPTGTAGTALEQGSEPSL